MCPPDEASRPIGNLAQLCVGFLRYVIDFYTNIIFIFIMKIVHKAQQTREYK